jgi:hypothetical protein
MSFYRQRWSVELDGVGTVEVTTSARDSQDIVVGAGPDGTPAMPLGVPLKIVHNALLRTEAFPPDVIPRNFQKFLDIVLDANEIPDEAGEDAAADVDPTQSEVSAA